MLDLDKIPKKTLRRSKWLTVLMLFLAIGFTPAYLDSISSGIYADETDQATDYDRKTKINH